MKTNRRNGGQPEIGRLAVVISGGGYSTPFINKIKKSRYKYKSYAWSQFHDLHRSLDFIEIDETVDILKSDKITHVVNIGLLTPPLMKFLLDAENRERTLKKVAKGERFVNKPRTFYKKYERHLRRAKIVILSARDFIEDYWPHKGYMGSVRRDRDLKSRLTKLHKLAKDYCTGEMYRYIAQSVIFDDGKYVRIETAGTDDMLSRLPPKKPGVERILVKALPKGFPAKLDPPTIGPQTIEFAQKAGVDIIAISVSTGLIVGRELTARAADGANIVLFGL